MISRAASRTSSERPSATSPRPSISALSFSRVRSDAGILSIGVLLRGGRSPNRTSLISPIRRGCTPTLFPASLGLHQATKVLSERASEIFDDPAMPVGGNPKGDVNIVEFFDYRCPYCKQVPPALQSLLKEDHGLRFVYMEFPVLGSVSVVAAHAALAARQQGKYEAFHTAMMATKGQITEDSVYEVAGSVGIDVDRLRQDMNAPEIDQALKENSALAQALNIHGTPGFIIGRKIVPGALDLDALKERIAEARKG